MSIRISTKKWTDRKGEMTYVDAQYFWREFYLMILTILMNFSFPDVDKTLYGKHAKNMMKTDVKEKDNGYEVAIDLPGFKKDELHLELNDGYLTISAEKGLDKDEKDKNDKYIRRERYAGSMSRSF